MASLVRTFLPTSGANALAQHRTRIQPIAADFNRNTAQANIYFVLLCMTYGKKGQLLIFFSIKKKKAIYKILD